MAKITVTLVESTTKEIEVPNVVYRACKSATTGNTIAYYKADHEQNKAAVVYPASGSFSISEWSNNQLYAANTFDIEPHQFYEAYAKVMLQIESFVGLERLSLEGAQDGPY